MHFIEQWFGLSPDGGTGVTELLYGLGMAAAILLIIAAQHVRGGRTRADR